MIYGVAMQKITKVLLSGSPLAISAAMFAATPAQAANAAQAPADVAASSAAAAALVQDAQPETAAAETGGDQIVVTGTRRTGRTVAESPVPVDVISGE